MRFSISNQIQIISYFKSADQSNSTSIKASSLETQQKIKTRASTDSSESKYFVAADIDHTNKSIRVGTSLTDAKEYNSVKSSIKRFKSFKSAVSISSLSLAPRLCSSANQIAGSPQHQHIATDGAPSLETQQKLKSSISSSRFSSAPRAYSPANPDARTPQIAIDVISSLKSRLKSKTSTTKSSRSFGQEYIVVADVHHTNKSIRVGTSLTNAEECNSVKSSIKSVEKFKSIKFSTFISCLSSAFRVCFSVNQVAGTPQYQHIEIDKVKLLKSFKSVKLLKSLNSAAIISSFSSTFRFSLSINYDSLISSRIDFLRALINQMIYASINLCLRRFR